MFSPFPLLSLGAHRDLAPGALLGGTTAPGQTPDPRLAAPGSWAAAQRRRLRDAGRGYEAGRGGEGGSPTDCCSARCPHSTAPGRPHPFPDCALRLLGWDPGPIPAPPHPLPALRPCWGRACYSAPPCPRLPAPPSGGAGPWGEPQKNGIKVDTRQIWPCYAGSGLERGIGGEMVPWDM